MRRAASLAAVLLLTLPEAAGAPETPKIKCMDPAMLEQVRAVLLTSLDAALSQHFVRLFDVWMKDGAERQPERAANGTRKGVEAYAVTRDYLQHWQLPPC